VTQAAVLTSVDVCIQYSVIYSTDFHNNQFQRIYKES